MRGRHHLRPQEFHELVTRFVATQALAAPVPRRTRAAPPPAPRVAAILERMRRILRELRHGL